MNEVIYCGVCGKTVYRHVASPITVRASLPSRTRTPTSAAALTDMMAHADEAHLEMVLRAERACVEHFQSEHSWRLRLWRRVGWKWLMQRRLPWGAIRNAEEFDFTRSARG